LTEFYDQNQLYVLDIILSFHAWYTCGSPYLLGTEEWNKIIDEGIHCILNEIKSITSRNQVDGSCKNFMMLHILRDMKMFGCPQNWDASPVLILLSGQCKEHKKDILFHGSGCPVTSFDIMYSES